MEEAVYVSCLDDLVHAHAPRFSRLYFGNDVCHHLLPSKDDLSWVRAHAQDLGLAFTLVTPILTEHGMGDVESLLPELRDGDEVVCNDVGLLARLRDDDLVTVVGRQLIKGTRDPRVRDDDLRRSGVLRVLSASTVSDAVNLSLFRDLGASRLELEGRASGWDLDLEEPWRSSLYHPFALLATTRRCQVVFADQLPEEGTCHRMCRLGQIEYSIARHQLGGSVREPVFWQGAGHYTVIVPRKEPDPSWKTDRLVYMPHPPARVGTLKPGATGSWERAYASGADRPWDPGHPSNELAILHSRLAAPATTQRSQGVLLDVGTGSGRNLPLALQHGYDVHALDPSATALSEVRARFPEVRTLASDLEGCSLPPGSVDVVQDFSVLHCAPPERHERNVARVHELLVPGGHWLLACWATDPAPGWFSLLVDGVLPEWGVAPSTLRELVRGRFHLVDAILLADAEPLPLAHYLLRKGEGPEGVWPEDPSHDGSFTDEHGRWRFEPGYPYPILERYLG